MTLTPRFYTKDACLAPIPKAENIRCGRAVTCSNQNFDRYVILILSVDDQAYYVNKIQYLI